MRLVLIAAAGVLTLAACQEAETAPPPAETVPPTGTTAPTPADPNALTAEGWSTLRIGMTVDQMTQAMGPDSDPDSVGGAEPDMCDQFRPDRAPEGLLVMTEQGVLTRISAIGDSDLVTDRGFGLGASAAEIKAAYGSAAQVEPHHYVEGAEYITIWNGGPRIGYVEDAAARGVRYETNAEGVVTAIHVGGPSIQYVEGCA